MDSARRRRLLQASRSLLDRCAQSRRGRLEHLTWCGAVPPHRLEAEFVVNLPGNLAPGTWYIGALADYHSQIGESNEANNNGNYLTITVPAQNLVERHRTTL